MNKSRDLLRIIHERNISQMNAINESAAEIGIYWYYKGEFIIYSEPVDEVPAVAGYRDVGVSHYNYWRMVQRDKPELRNLEYDEVPRGRIIADREGIVIYGPPSVIKNVPVRTELKRLFNITRKVRFRPDPHYTD